MKMKLIQTKDYLLLIDEEAEIKEEDYYYWELTNTVQINRLLEEDRKLGRTGPKGDVYKTIAYYPLTKEAKELDLPELPPFEEDNIVNEVERIFNEDDINHELYNEKEICNAYKAGIYDGYKAAQSKQFSLEDIKTVIKWLNKNYSLIEDELFEPYIGKEDEVPDVFFHSVYEEALNRGIQSLSTQQLPKEFKPIMVCGRCLKPDDNDEDCWSAKECSRNTDFPDTFKTITNSEGKQEIQGKYIW